jgi:fructose-bisphosphate aldolase class II
LVVPFAATSDLVSAAAARRGAVGAFDVVGLEHAEAVVAGAEAAGRAVVLRVGPETTAFRSGVTAIAVACRALAGQARVPVGLHLDGVADDAAAVAAPAAGFGSLTLDGAAEPFGRLVARARAVTERAHLAGLWVEVALAGPRTDPDEAALFLVETSVDALAVSLGAGAPDLELLARLHAALPVPLTWPAPAGVPDDALGAAVECGIVKVSVVTDAVFTSAVRAALAADPEVADPRRWLAPARDAVAAEVARVVDVLG